jgi:hypothetical protein
VKTAISVPDQTFALVTRRASELGMSRSEFFSRAAQRYLEELEADSLTAQIDRVVERLDGSDDAQAVAVAAGKQVLRAVEDEW